MSKPTKQDIHNSVKNIVQDSFSKYLLSCEGQASRMHILFDWMHEIELEDICNGMSSAERQMVLEMTRHGWNVPALGDLVLEGLEFQDIKQEIEAAA
jgi:hypothetical protein